jgi:hypothetical protein
MLLQARPLLEALGLPIHGEHPAPEPVAAKR